MYWTVSVLILHLKAKAVHSEWATSSDSTISPSPRDLWPLALTWVLWESKAVCSWLIKTCCILTLQDVYDDGGIQGLDLHEIHLLHERHLLKMFPHDHEGWVQAGLHLSGRVHLPLSSCRSSASRRSVTPETKSLLGERVNVKAEWCYYSLYWDWDLLIYGVCELIYVQYWITLDEDISDKFDLLLKKDCVLIEIFCWIFKSQ